MKLNIGIILGGPSPEHDISILTGLQAGRILEENHNVSIIFWSKDNKWYINETSLEAEDFLDFKKVSKKPLNVILNDDPGFYLKKKKVNYDVVVNCCHGGPGEDGRLQALLELINIPYTGPNTSLAQICMDKYLFTLLLQKNDLPVLDRFLLDKSIKDIEIEGPYILKPRYGGSSIGVEVVKDIETAQSLAANSELYSQGAVIEKYLEDSEDYLVAAFGYPEINISDIEKPIRANESTSIFNYSDKYLRNGGLEGSSRELPAKLSKDVEEEFFSLTIKLIELIGIRGVYRIDYLKDANNIYINEVNSIPGSLSTYLWKNKNISKLSIIENIVQEAMQSKDDYTTTYESDGKALSQAKEIESKLG